MLSTLLVADGSVATTIIVVCGLIGMIFAALYAHQTSKISLYADGESIDERLLTAQAADDGPSGSKSIPQRIREISSAISTGANAFLYREYQYMAVFMVFMTILIIVLIGSTGGTGWDDAVFTAIAFDVGAATSILSGWVGMKIAVYSNSRTALEATKGYGPAFVTAFKAGIVMGFSLVSFGVLILYIMINFFRLHYHQVGKADCAVSTPFGNVVNPDCFDYTKRMFEAVAGYGLGGSSIALFGRVGGGIYTKAADVGADLCGKLEMNIPEDDPRNPAVIADNVGDNVGDIAGMGADLFGSFAEATCAAMVITSQSTSLFNHWVYLTFPIMITSTGIVVCLITSFVATHISVVTTKEGIEPSLKRQLLVSTVLMTPVAYGLCVGILPHNIEVVSTATNVKNWHIFFCIAMGLWSGLAIGYITEYYTSNTYRPVQEVAEACETGAATNIIYGLALGYKSVIIPIFCLALTIYVSYTLAAMYGIAMAALGILSTMAIGLTIDAYGPICDNAGGIAEMAGMGDEIRERTDALDAAGNTTAAIGKGFAIGSAALVSLALFGGFVTIIQNEHLNKLGMLPADCQPGSACAQKHLFSVNLLRPFVFAGLLVGAMLPYWFSAMTMKSVGSAALAMVQEVRRQFTEHPEIMDGVMDPDYSTCVAISTDASLKHMIPPGILVMGTPLIVGYLFGVEALAGVLTGSLVSGVQIAISASNTGGAWDNAKKYIEEGAMGGKGSEPHHAAVVGDTVGDPLKDTSGPSLNILVKLSAIISLVFARSFAKSGRGLIEQLWHA